MFSYFKTLKSQIVSGIFSYTKTTFFVGMLFLLLSQSSTAQRANQYSFSSSISPNAFIELANPTKITSFSGSADDRFTTQINIGFTFRFAGVNYTTFAVSENGWMTLGAEANSNADNKLKDQTTPRPILAPLWDDLKMFSSGAIIYETSGAENNKVLTVQWLNFYYDKTAEYYDVSFQVTLYEKGNKIEFSYSRDVTNRANNNASASIGIAGKDIGDFISIKLSTRLSKIVADTSTNIETNNINARPENNSVFTFTPPPTIEVPTASITDLVYCQSQGPSPAKSFTVTGTDLTDNIVVTAPSNFQVSKDSNIFSNSINITPTGSPGTANQKVWVRAIAGLTTGSYFGNVSCSSTGATNNVNVAVSALVKPTPSVNAISNQTICNGQSTAAINFSGSSVSGTVYNWNNSLNSIGLAGSGQGSINSFAATNTGTTPSIATITVTPVANTCSGSSKTATITVNPTPSVSNISNRAACSGVLNSSIVFPGTVSGTLFDWTNTNTSIGIASSGTNTVEIPAFTTSNGSSGSQVATITVTPKANNCTGQSKTFTITVYPLPSAPSIDGPAAVCQNAKNLSFNVASPVAAISYTWTKTTTNISGIISSVGNNGQNAIVSFSNAGTATLKLEATDVNGCKNAINKDIAVTTNPSLPADVKVIYNGSDLVCLYNLADSLQWGYDDVNLKSQDIINEVAQNYYLPNATFNNTRYYWVKIFTAGKSCNSRFYYNNPSGRLPEPPRSTGAESFLMRLFPNPVQGNVTVQWDGTVFSDGVTIVINDITGRTLLIKEVIENVNHQIVLPLSQLGRGTYFINITGNNGAKAVSKLIKL